MTEMSTDNSFATSLDSFRNNLFHDYQVRHFKYDDTMIVQGDEILCAKCRTVKYRKVFNKMADTDIWMPTMCKCESAKRAEQRTKEEEEERKLKAIRMREEYSSDAFMTAIGRRYRDVRFSDDFYYSKERDNDFIAVRERLVNFVKNFEAAAAKNLGWYLWSENRGNGKTSLSACVRNGLLDRGISCAIVSTDTLYRLSKAHDKEYDKCVGARCLIIDDIGLDKLTEWESGILHDVVNFRYLNDGYVTCYTSNVCLTSDRDEEGKKKEVDLEEMGVKVATISRMDEVTPRIMHLGGESMRVRA